MHCWLGKMLVFFLSFFLIAQIIHNNNNNTITLFKLFFCLDCTVLVNNDDSQYYHGKLGNMKIIDLEVFLFSRIQLICSPNFSLAFPFFL